MEKEFIPFEQALALKELKFDEPCIGFYSINNQHYDDGYFHLSTENPFSNDIEPINQSKYCISAPTFSQAFRWFREKHNLHSYIEGPYPWFRYYINSPDNRYEGFKHLVFEEAELQCLKTLIEIVKLK